MKHYFIIILSLLLPFLAYAQQDESQAAKPQRTAEEIAEYQTAMLKRDLGLSDDQIVEVYKINLKYAQQGRPQNQQLAEERIKQKLSDLKAILNEQQYAQFVKKMSEIKHMRGGMKLTPMPAATDTMRALKTDYKHSDNPQ